MSSGAWKDPEGPLDVDDDSLWARARRAPLSAEALHRVAVKIRARRQPRAARPRWRIWAAASVLLLVGGAAGAGVATLVIERHRSSEVKEAETTKNARPRIRGQRGREEAPSPLSEPLAKSEPANGLAPAPALPPGTNAQRTVDRKDPAAAQAGANSAAQTAALRPNPAAQAALHPKPAAQALRPKPATPAVLLSSTAKSAAPLTAPTPGRLAMTTPTATANGAAAPTSALVTPPPVTAAPGAFAPVPTAASSAATTPSTSLPPATPRIAPAADPAPLLVPAPASAEARLLRSALTALHHQRDPGAALQYLDQYDVRFPDGTLRAEATLARVQSLRELGRDDDLLRLLERVRLAGMPRAAELRVLRGELRMTRGQLSEALADFEAGLVAGGSDAILERALFGRASCRSRLGQVEEARADLQRYLERFPSSPRAAQIRATLAR